MDFIDDEDLRHKADNALKYATYLMLSHYKNSNENFKEETCRVIVLYIASILEAVLLYLYSKQGKKIEKIEYKEITILKPVFQNKENGGETVLAIKTKKVISENNIGIHELIKHFEKNKIITKAETGVGLNEINEMRNTHHLSKDRNQKCTIIDVEKALEMLIYTLEKVPLILSKSK